MQVLPLLVAASALVGVAACGERSEVGVPAAAALRTSAAVDDPRLFLLPESPRAVLGREFRLRLCRGDLRDFAPQRRIDDSFDPFVARVGGTQHNELQPDLVDDAAGVSHVFAQPGDAMVGFSTRPRRGRLDGEDVELAQHVKALLFVAQGERDLPQPSAALSHRIGLEFELVPMVDPLPLLPGELLPVRLRLGGPGLAGAEITVQITPRRSPGGAPGTEHFRGVTDEVGAVVVPIGDPGRYLISAEHRRPGDGSLPRVDRAVLTFDVGAKQ